MNTKQNKGRLGKNRRVNATKKTTRNQNRTKGGKM